MLCIEFLFVNVHADLTTLVPPLITCMSTLQVPFECETRLSSENSACTGKGDMREFKPIEENFHSLCYFDHFK